MKVGVVVPTFDQYAQNAHFRKIVLSIENLGYDSAWFGDHVVFPREYPSYLNPCWFEALSCAMVGLGMTSRLKFGTDVLVAPYRNPVLLAKMATTASQLSDGRLMLGMGIGWLEGEFDALSTPAFSSRAKATEEYLSVMRRLFEQDGPISFSGNWIELDEVTFEPKPAYPLPLLVGGNHEKAVQRAALYGDGWHPLFMSDSDYAKGKRAIQEARQAQQITRPFTFSYSCSNTRILSADSAPRLSEPGESSSYAPSKPVDKDGRPRFIGTTRQMRQDCEVYARAGVEQLVIRFAIPLDGEVDIEEYLHQLEWFAGEVLPHCHAL